MTLPNRNRSVCWIDYISAENAGEPLKSIYDSVRNPNGNLDNLYRAFSLRAHTIRPADDLYRAALHHEHNQLPKDLGELVGCHVALLTGCDYAFTHHSHNYRHLIDDDEKAQRVFDALREGDVTKCGNDLEIAAMTYVRKLTLTPDEIACADVDMLRSAGWGDGEILEIAQITAMFAYFIRVINGVGISLSGDKIGLY